MLRRILSNRQELFLTELRRWLSELQTTLAQFGAQDEDLATLERSVQQLDELFLLVIVGEFNSGKSAFINALLGQDLLEQGVTPTTMRINLLKYGDTVERTEINSALDIVTAPVELLREINIVDTPGTNAIHREHEAITQEFVPRSDLVLFVTSVDRPLSESERVFIERIRDWGKKVVFVINKIDILQDFDDLARIISFITENARKMFGFTPETFPISARQALRAKLLMAQSASEDANTTDAVAEVTFATTDNQEAQQLWADSCFFDLENYIMDILDEVERIRLKLLNPLRIGTRLIDGYVEVIEGRLDLLRGDFVTIGDIDRQMTVYREDMARDFRYRLSNVDNVLHEFENRGMAFFDETMRLQRIRDLIRKDMLKEEFKREVIADVPQVIEERVNEIIDWLVASNLHQWEAVMEHLAERRTKHADRIVGQVGGSFDYDRGRLLETVGRSAQRAVNRYDREGEASRIAESLQMAVASTALVEIGAVGMGTILTIIATTTVADLTGILAAGAIAALGLFVIPARKRRAKQELRDKIADMREQLMSTLTEQFDHELERSLQHIDKAISPYTRFVRAENEHLNSKHEEFTNIRDELIQLDSKIKAM